MAKEEVKIIKIAGFPPDLPRQVINGVSTGKVYATWAKTLEDLKEIAKQRKANILLIENAITNEEKIEKGFFSAHRKLVVSNSDIYLIRGEGDKKEVSMWYGFWNVKKNMDFSGICDFCGEKLDREDATCVAKGTWIGYYHKNCIIGKDDKIKELINTLPEEKLAEAMKKL